MDQEKIGKFIAECRKKKKMTQEQLGNKLGVSAKSVSRWETGKCMPDLSLIKELCLELDISINDFLSGEKIDKKDYNTKLEENIINVTAYTTSKKKKNIYVKIVIFIFLVVFGWLTINTIDTSGLSFINIDEYFDTRELNKRIENNDYEYFIDNIDYDYMYEVYYRYEAAVVDNEHMIITYDYSKIMSFQEYEDYINEKLKSTLKKVKVNKLKFIEGYGSPLYRSTQVINVQYGINPDDMINYHFNSTHIEIRFSYTTLVGKDEYGEDYMPPIYLKNNL